MITANEARIQQAGNNHEMIERNMKEIEDRIKIAIRSNKTTTTHYINGMANAVAVASRVKEYGYSANNKPSQDPRDGDLIVMTIGW
ncbi:hypothetical protein phiAS5_ORF0095 [Aeromonas phage phiAS5]|uniref:Uncharacterized protein n=1 Tax=Aeromonas phage phiAS5 TaxID=879630 RepID=E1A2J2_9CAUD|nr:hypothetical protein phiAS5_ORF0095 [Aeromonas phage phiAS5]ADM79938.1 hypothetical protein phiAS5_ORF0095 [Aeromonas phage phiAS5]